MTTLAPVHVSVQSIQAINERCATFLMGWLAEKKHREGCQRHHYEKIPLTSVNEVGKWRDEYPAITGIPVDSALSGCERPPKAPQSQT